MAEFAVVNGVHPVLHGRGVRGRAEFRQSGPRCLGGVRIRFNRGAGDHRAQEVDGGDLAHQLLRRGRGRLLGETVVDLEIGQRCHRVDAEGPADADNGSLAHLAPDKLLGQGGALDPRQPADIGRAGVRRNAVQPALEGFGGEGHGTLSGERTIGLILAAGRRPLHAVPGTPARPDLCHPDQRQAHDEAQDGRVVDDELHESDSRGNDGEKNTEGNG